MKKLIVAVSTTVMLGSAGAALAGGPKQTICHNGSTYNAGTEMEDPISFEITIAGKQNAKAVDKHVENHGDFEWVYLVLGPGEECELLDDDSVECKEVTLCEEDV